MSTATAEMRLVVRGRVQGVGFRWFVRERARRWGLTGWVRNRPDGTVELAARGDPASLDGLRRDVATGPPNAVVDSVIDLEPDNGSTYDDPFAVRRG
jgi:acylphosphatase